MAEKKTRKRSPRAKKPAVYTYRCGEKVVLEKSPDQFVVRQLPGALAAAGMAAAEQVSSASARVTCQPSQLESMMTRAREVAPTHHAYRQAEHGYEFLITDRVLVSFKEALGAEDVGRFAGKYGLEMLGKYTDRDYLFRLTDATGMNPVKLVVRLTEDEGDVIATVDHDLNSRCSRYLDLPTDPSYDQQWHLHRRTPPSADYDPRSSSRCEEAWLLADSFGSSDVVIGFTDDGCKLDHPDFDSPNKFAGWGYFEGNRFFRRGDPGADPDDMHSPGDDHGTSCGGVIGADIDGQMTVGAAPGCRLLPIKWQVTPQGFLAISDSKMLAALDYVADKVDVLSNSWGSTPTTSVALLLRNRLRQLAQTGGRRGKGILFLWAAGNENCPISHVSSQDVPFTSGVRRLPDGRLVWIGVETARVFRNDRVEIPGVLHVAALASHGQRSHYSNYGDGIDLCAPSNNVHAYRRLFLPGLGITTTTGSGSLVTPSFGGTSSATPLVAGIAGLVISANPQLTATDVASVLKRTASKDLDESDYPDTPPASFDPNPTWDVSPVAPFDDGAFVDHGDADGTWSPWFGHGNVDAAAAVASVRQQAGEQRRQVVIEREADLTIPDANAAGVVSRVFVESHGRIQSLKVRVDITHTFRGDLEVALRAPDGRRALLHDREGSNADNLVRTYAAANAPELAGLHGLEVHGSWSLEVADRAAFDVGRLNRWTLDAEVTGDSALRVESAPGTTIPDDDPDGIRDTVTLNDPRAVSDLAVEIDISHTFIGDLRVVLVGPGGAQAVLHDQAGFDADNIRRTYTPDVAAGLAAFVGQPAAGQWVLRVSDHVGQDVGKLNRWGLVIV